MARPFKISLEDGGEIVLRNTTKELADKVRKAVGKGGKESEMDDEAPAAPAPSPVPASMSATAVGVAQEKGQWVAYEVSFDPNKTEAQVTQRYYCGTDREAVEEKFKLLAFRNGLI